MGPFLYLDVPLRAGIEHIVSGGVYSESPVARLGLSRVCGVSVSVHGFWPDLVSLLTRQLELALSLLTIEIGRALCVWGSEAGQPSGDSSDAEFERRHGDAGWFENEKPRRANTRLEKIMLWLGFEKY